MTVGWIRERDEERFYEARFRVPDPDPNPSAQFPCPFCNHQFDRLRILYDHLHEQHTLPRPVLFLNGREPASHDLIGDALSVNEVTLLNCSRIDVGMDTDVPRECTPEVLRSALAAKRTGIVRIRLSSGTGPSSPIFQEYALRFSVASASELERVDRLFVSRLGRSGPHLSSVGKFLAEAGQGAWSDYAGALADYVVGVLAKDRDPRTGVRPPFADYADHYRRSLAVLSKYDRPLPFLLGSIIRFTLNDFDVKGPTGFDDLDAAVCLLQNLTVTATREAATPRAGKPAKSGETRAICPLDAGTSFILAAVRHLQCLESWSPRETTMVDSIDAPNSIGPLDKAKLVALLAWAALRLDERSKAVPLLERLTGNDCFSNWASAELEGSTER